MSQVNSSTGRILYVAEPIDQSDMGQWKGSVARMIQVAVDRGWLVYRPAGSWRVAPGTEIGHEIESVNRAILEHARAFVGFFPAGVPTIGTPRELEWAVAHGTPTLAVTDVRGAWSLADTDRIEVDDVPSFGKWLQAVEASGVDPRRKVGVAFMLDGGQLPTRTNSGDAGYDLYASEDVHVEPGKFVDVSCGIRMALPPGVWARITGRSSTLRKRNLLVSEGIIDTGYRGPLYSGVVNMGEDTELIRAGERIAQLILHDNIADRYVPFEVDSGYFARIPGDSRGEAGFGSTGR